MQLLQNGREFEKNGSSCMGWTNLCMHRPHPHINTNYTHGAYFVKVTEGIATSAKTNRGCVTGERGKGRTGSNDEKSERRNKKKRDRMWGAIMFKLVNP